MARPHRAPTAPGRMGLLGRSALAAGCVAGVMHAGLAYTYDTSVFDLSGPLAFVGLVPVAAAVVAWSRWHHGSWPEARPQRGADLVIAALLLVAGLVVAVQAPLVFGGETLAWRADLACLPFVVGGVLALVFGVRVLHRVWVAVALLALMSPAAARPVVSALDALAQAVTAMALPVLSQAVPGVSYAPGGVSEYLLLAGPDGGFTVSVAQACSGAGLVMLGGLLALTGVLATQRAPGAGARRPWAWPVVVMALFAAANVARLAALLVAGVNGGQSLMLDTVHPLGGTVAATGAALVSLALLPVFGRVPRRRLGSQGGRAGLAKVRSALPPLRPATAAGVVVVALAMAVPARAATTSQDLVTGGSRAPMASVAEALRSWEGARPLGVVPWASAYFGSGSRWERALLPAPPGTTGVPAVQVDAIATRQPSTLDQYGLAACFRFHGYDVIEEGQRPLASGRTAQFVVYRDPAADQVVTVLAWRQRLTGGAMERVALSHRAPAADAGSVEDLAGAALWMLWAAERGADPGGGRRG